MAERFEQPEADPALENAPGAAGVSAALAAALGRRGRKTAANDPELDTFLEAHTRLARLQAEHLHEMRELIVSRLRWGRAGDRLRVLWQASTAVIALAVVALVVTMGWQARQARGLVVDAFSVPPDLAREGLTGEVAAARFLDRLQAMQTATQSERPSASYENNWGHEIKLEIPEAGFTFADIERFLREKLGHVSHVTGEVLRTPTGLSLTARLGDAAPQTFAGAAGDFDTLAQKAAEAVYRTSQPYRYAQYLSGQGRIDEAIAVDTDLAENGPPGERGWAWSSLAVSNLQRGDIAGAQRAVAAGLAAGGDAVEWVNISRAALDGWLGHDEDLLNVSRTIAREQAPKRLSELSQPAFEENRLSASGYLAGQTGDYAKAAADYSTLARSKHFLTSGSFYAAQAAWARALAHDGQGAREALAEAGPLGAKFYAEAAANGWYAQPAYQVDAEAGDWPAALADLRAVDALIEAHQTDQPGLRLMQPAVMRPLEARALLRTGDLKGAATLIGSTPLDCYLCVRVRAEVAEASGDRAGADRWYAEAVRQAPHIPFAYVEWGAAKLARGDVSGAIADFQTAHRLEPRFADPLKYWGDALARQRAWSEAVAKYDQALRLAPAWQAARQARDAAAQARG
ncbi:MAG: hypothetical protein JO111_10960 [Caulobacteraceae bacterium]|nr:hypothetical protein [Caulobacteraceae bacterium]